jgi:hypothetical protein
VADAAVLYLNEATCIPIAALIEKQSRIFDWETGAAGPTLLIGIGFETSMTEMAQT